MRDKPSAFAKATADKPVFLSCTLFSLRGAAPRPYPSVPAYGRAGSAGTLEAHASPQNY